MLSKAHELTSERRRRGRDAFVVGDPEPGNGKLITAQTKERYGPLDKGRLRGPQCMVLRRWVVRGEERKSLGVAHRLR